MAVRRILPIAVPDITSYTHVTYALSVMHTDRDALRWVYSNYVQLFTWDWGHAIKVDHYTQTAEHHLVPCLGGSQRITRKMLGKYPGGFVNFARENIEEGYYVWACVDEFYIPGTSAYQNRSYPHAVFIYGYDDDRSTFMITGYFQNQRYGEAEVSYADMEKAYYGFEPEDEINWTNFVRMLKLNSHYKKFYEFKTHWVMEQLEEYWLAKPSSRRMEAFEETWTHQTIWGSDVYDILQLQIDRHIAKQGIVDHRPFYVLWEHKRMMNRRIAYMEENGFYEVSDRSKEEWRKIEQSALQARNLELKYLMSFNNRFLEQLKERLAALKQEESNAIERMLEDYARSGGKKHLHILKEEA
ncbi:hypothetical protein [Cohnella mopanensis]|uniref:hypothetical protein n=1 Tax=Cohnella mopanensis TaxID=2911966 RepID=UPI001EF948EF|nr:hypothetical protein [Cohnella mopanensis]